MKDGGRKSGDNNEIIYLDNAATTFPKPERIYAAADDFYRRYGGNAGRGGNPLARACTHLLAETRERLASWLEVPTSEQIIFTPSATHALNLAIFGANLRPGETIYVTPFEHNSVLRPVEYLRQTQGIELQQIPFDRHNYSCELDKLEASFQTEPPAMVCVTQASNVCGLMPPVTDIARLAKNINPRVVIIVDGAQTAGLYPLTLNEGLIDAFIFSGHKSLYGPYGVAGIVLASDWRPRPLLFGGTGTISESVQMPDQLPSAYEAGSHNIWAIAGLHAALGWLQENGRQAIVQHIANIAQQLRDTLSSHPKIKLFVPSEKVLWCGILSFTVRDTTPQTVEAALGAQKMAIRSGLHCSPWAHEWLMTTRIGGTIRVSPGWFNTSSDIELIGKFISTL